MCIIHQSGQTYYNFFIPVVEYCLEEKIVGASMIYSLFYFILIYRKYAILLFLQFIYYN